MRAIVCVLLLFLMVFPLLANNQLEMQQFAQTSEGNLLAWVVFKDKGGQNPALFKASDLVSARSLERRKLRRPNRPLVEYSDLPVFQPYLEEIKNRVRKVRVVSRWLNAVSVEASANDLQQISQLDFTLTVEPLLVADRVKRDKIEKGQKLPAQ